MSVQKQSPSAHPYAQLPKWLRVCVCVSPWHSHTPNKSCVFTGTQQRHMGPWLLAIKLQHKDKNGNSKAPPKSTYPLCAGVMWCVCVCVFVCVWLHILLSWRPNKLWNINTKTEREYRQFSLMTAVDKKRKCVDLEYVTHDNVLDNWGLDVIQLVQLGLVVTRYMNLKRHQTSPPFTDRCSTHVRR